MTQQELLQNLRREKDGKIVGDRMREILKLLLHYRFTDAEVDLLAQEVELLKRKPHLRQKAEGLNRCIGCGRVYMFCECPRLQ